jgi:microcystin-dependent protein
MPVSVDNTQITFNDATVQTTAATGAQTGSVLMWVTNTAPSGFLLCDGASVSTTTFAALFAVIGYTFGGSGGSFTLPDFRNRFPVGSGTSYAIAATGGSADAVVVSHGHTVTDPGHTHVMNPSYNSGQNFGQVGRNDASQSRHTAATQSATTGITIANAGVSGTNANLPPYLGISFIIKT